MFAQTVNTRSSFTGPSYISDRTARNSAQGAYDSALASASQANRDRPKQKGFGAGSGRMGFDRSRTREAGYADARNSYANTYMDAIEANREARLSSEASQAKEANALAGLIQGLAQADFADRYSAASSAVDLQRGRDAISNSAMGTQSDLFSRLLRGLLS
jgi:hypothetical protein